uniref:Uncharacterized protein n=1 Tax=Triticum urartu TaxID=4572 RepID=A0A8R7UXF1_TRIUA
MFLTNFIIDKACLLTYTWFSQTSPIYNETCLGIQSTSVLIQFFLAITHVFMQICSPNFQSCITDVHSHMVSDIVSYQTFIFQEEAESTLPI